MLAIRDKTTFDQAVETLKFLSDGNRLRILSALAESETCVCDLIDDLDLSQTLISYHLAKLRKAGLVRARRHAQWMYYSLDPDAWRRLIEPLAGLLLPAPLPPTAEFGASHNCDDAIPDPARGACGCEDGLPEDELDEPALSSEAIDRLTDEVLSRLMSRLEVRPGDSILSRTEFPSS